MTTANQEPSLQTALQDPHPCRVCMGKLSWFLGWRLLIWNRKAPPTSLQSASRQGKFLTYSSCLGDELSGFIIKLLGDRSIPETSLLSEEQAHITYGSFSLQDLKAATALPSAPARALSWPSGRCSVGSLWSSHLMHFLLLVQSGMKRSLGWSSLASLFLFAGSKVSAHLALGPIPPGCFLCCPTISQVPAHWKWPQKLLLLSNNKRESEGIRLGTRWRAASLKFTSKSTQDKSKLSQLLPPPLWRAWWWCFS